MTSKNSVHEKRSYKGKDINFPLEGKGNLFQCHLPISILSKEVFYVKTKINYLQ